MGGHLVWDWNGTLFDDRAAALGATNDVFSAMGLPAMSLDEYQAAYFAPVREFYRSLLGRAPSDAEWEEFDAVFHAQYHARFASCSLAAGAEQLLGDWRAAGGTQSVLSMYRHESLQPLVAGFGIGPQFVRVDGRRGPSGAAKAGELTDHLARLRGEDGLAVDPARIVVIGDTADDGEAARHVGATAVLHTGGSQGRAALERTGFPVVDSLTLAVEAAREALDAAA